MFSDRTKRHLIIGLASAEAADIIEDSAVNGTLLTSDFAKRSLEIMLCDKKVSDKAIAILENNSISGGSLTAEDQEVFRIGLADSTGEAAEEIITEINTI